MSKGRLEAFSDGVIAILITIMVLELKVPHGTNWEALRPLAPIFFTYILSFIFLGIYWNNHHHMVQAAERINGKILWANMHLLFWLSLVPFATGWMGENDFAPLPTAIYGAVLLLSGIAYSVLQSTIVAAQSLTWKHASALRRNTKGVISVILYAAAIPLAFVSQWIAYGIYIAVVLLWLMPDRRIEVMLNE